MEHSPYKYDPVARQFIPRDTTGAAGGGMRVDPISVGAAELGRVRPPPPGRGRLILWCGVGILAVSWVVVLVFWSQKVDKGGLMTNAVPFKMEIPLPINIR